MEESLPLLSPAVPVSGFACFFELRNVPHHGAPSFDLAFVVVASPSHEVSAIPLKPTPRVIRVNPALIAPEGEWLGSIHAKKIQTWVVPFVTKSCVFEPVSGKLGRAISHVLAAENSEFQHFLRRKFGLEVRMEISTLGRFQRIHVTVLHAVVDYDELSRIC